MARTALATAGLSAATDFTKQRTAPQVMSVEDHVTRQRATQTESESTDLMKSGLAGAGAGFLFGPVAGLLVMGVSKFLHDRNRQGIEAYMAQSAERSDAILSSSQAAIDELANNATTDQERAEVAMLQKQYDSLSESAFHPDQQVAAQSLLKMQELTGTLYNNLDDWQAERTAEAERLAADNKRNFDIADNIRGDTQREATRYIAALESFDKLEALKGQGTTASDTALVKSLANLVEPGAIITDSDFAVLQQNPAITDEAARLYMSVIQGKGTLTEPQRAEIFNTGRVIMQEQVGYQVERNDAAVERARMANLDEGYFNSVIVPIPDSIRDRTRNPAPVPKDKPEETFTPVQDTATAGIIARGIKGLNDIIQDAGRALRGEQVMIDGEGRMVVRDPNGDVIEDLGYADEWKNGEGDTIRRHNGPNGPVFENVSRNKKMRRDARQAEYEANREPGLFQPGGFFDRRRQERETND